MYRSFFSKFLFYFAAFTIK
uniref:Uncharacterized protein n=1 Tax=Anguilla anguilla TaxID=7936 RepID=A0A0E9XIK6_ANGAN